MSEHWRIGAVSQIHTGIPEAGTRESSLMLYEMAHTPEGFRLDGPIVPTRFPEIGALRVPLRFGQPGGAGAASAASSRR